MFVILGEQSMTSMTVPNEQVMDWLTVGIKTSIIMENIIKTNITG